MARPLRIEYEGAFYHVTSRGNERRDIFLALDDYRRFKHYLIEAQDKYDFHVHAYVLMTNHYHLIVETNKANLQQIMHYLNGSYTTYFNRKRRRNGHLFQGRYKAIVVDIDNYLLELSRYLHLNPVRAGMVKKPEEYAVSSYRSYIGRRKEELVFRDRILGMISRDERKGMQEYQKFVEEGLKRECKNPLKSVYGGGILGGEGFIREMLRKVGTRGLEDQDISCRRQLKITKEMGEIIESIGSYFKIQPSTVLEKKGIFRDIAIYLGKKYTGLTNREIGEVFEGLSYSGVTRAYQRFEEKMVKSEKLGKQVEKINNRLSNVKG